MVVVTCCLLVRVLQVVLNGALVQGPVDRVQVMIPPAVPAEKEWRSGHVKVILIKAAEVTEVALILHGRRLGGPWYASRHACVVKSKEL